MSTDTSAERPDECPVEGNPVLPSSAQKVQYETDYDNGALLRFARAYGSERVGVGAANAMTHSFSANIPSAQAPAAVRRADGTLLRLNRVSPTLYRSYSSDLAYTITATGSYPNLRLSIVSPFEPVLESYDANGWLESRSYAHGVVHTLTYANGAGSYLPPGPACVLPAGVTPPTQVAPYGALQCVSDPFGRQLNFFVDARGRIVKLIDPAGGVIDYAYDEPSSFVAAGRKPSNNLTSVRYPDGFHKQFHYNEATLTGGANLPRALTGISEAVPPAGFTRFSTYKYDAVGRAISTELTGPVMRHSMLYGPGGGTVSVTDPLGTIRTHALSVVQGAKRRTSTQQPAGSGSSPCSDARIYDTQANVTSSVDFNGNKTCYAHNLARNLEIKRVEGVAASADCATALASPPAGARLISTEWHPYWRLQTRIAEPKKITTIAYNDNGATCAPSDALIAARRIAVACSSTEQGTTDETGATGFSATISGSPRTWNYTYGSYGRVLTATDPNNRTTTISYHSDTDANLGKRGNIASVTNAANQTIYVTDYDAHGQPTRVVDRNGVTTTVTYDARLRLRSLTTGSEVTQFDYHPAGHLVKATMPDASTLTYGYDAAHRLTSIQDQKGNRVTYTLNGVGTRTKEEIRDSAGVLARNISTVVDALNRFQQITGATP